MLTDEAGLVEQIGRYTIVRLIGQGAMGRVLLAHDAILDRQVAIKVLRDDLGLPPEHLLTLYERMRQEARASARISHPNMVALFDMGEDQRVGLFLVFEYVEGLTLKGRIAQGSVGPELVRKLALELGSALAEAHQAGVLHRDIKPENVILARNGAKIADFGIARVPDSTLTRDGRLLGTPAYSAPEAISHGTFSPATDQFSLATTLYEALSLHRAFPGDDAVAVAARITYEEPPGIAAICGLDSRVDTVFARALSKNPKARYDSCLHFTQALAEVLALPGRRSTPTLADVESRAPLPRLTQTHNTRLAAVAAVVGGLLALALAQVVKNFQVPMTENLVDAGAPSAGTLRTQGEVNRRGAVRPRSNSRSSFASAPSTSSSSLNLTGIAPAIENTDSGVATESSLHSP
jgi:eukaryotic-like serine/threonine-protein kinase